MCNAWFPKASVTSLKNCATSSFDFSSMLSRTCSIRCGWSRRQASTINSRGEAPYVCVCERVFRASQRSQCSLHRRPYLRPRISIFRDIDVVSVCSRAAVTRRLGDLKRGKRSGAAVESRFGQCAKFAVVGIRYIHKRSWIESLRSHQVDTVVSPQGPSHIGSCDLPGPPPVSRAPIWCAEIPSPVR